MAAEQFAANREAWEKLTNTKAQQRAAEIEAAKDMYRALVKGQVLSKEQIIDNEERYAVALANINEKYGKGAAKEAKKVNEEALKHAEEMSRIQLSINDASARAVASSIKETEALQKKIEQEQYETSIIGKTKEQIALLEAARYDHATAILEETLALNESFGVNTQEIEQLRKQIELRKELRDHDRAGRGTSA
jgi:predicted nucleic acid-binding protein